mmetsp:Transcript_24902/g.41632  ORF Transcript_24902/g.41632 Transcript_24902/m.41632 type:complete len:337 (-) Transcript_24902:424-1434(-)
MCQRTLRLSQHRPPFPNHSQNHRVLLATRLFQHSVGLCPPLERDFTGEEVVCALTVELVKHQHGIGFGFDFGSIARRAGVVLPRALPAELVLAGRLRARHVRTSTSLLNPYAAFRTGLGGQMLQLARFRVFGLSGFYITAFLLPATHHLTACWRVWGQITRSAEGCGTQRAHCFTKMCVVSEQDDPMAATRVFAIGRQYLLVCAPFFDKRLDEGALGLDLFGGRAKVRQHVLGDQILAFGIRAANCHHPIVDGAVDVSLPAVSTVPMITAIQGIRFLRSQRILADSTHHNFPPSFTGRSSSSVARDDGSSTGSGSDSLCERVLLLAPIVIATIYTM